MATQLFQPVIGSLPWLDECIERGKVEVFDERIMLTPALAQALLDRNTNNRNIKEVKMSQVVRDISNGRWRYNGVAVQVRKDGILGDGQHRCLGVVRTGIAIPVKIGFGLDQEAIDTLDIGAARTPGDIAGMHGVEDPMLAAAIARLLIGFEANDGRKLGKTTAVTSTEIQDRLKRDRKIQQSAAFARGAGRKMPVIGSIVGLSHYLLSAVHRRDADEYLTKLATGAELREGDPALTVREFLSRRAGKGAKATGREKRLEAIFRGWVAFREERQLRSLTLTGSFPELI